MSQTSNIISLQPNLAHSHSERPDSSPQEGLYQYIKAPLVSAAHAALEFRATYFKLSDASLFIRLINGLAKVFSTGYADITKSTNSTIKFVKILRNLENKDWTIHVLDLFRNLQTWHKLSRVSLNYINILNYGKFAMEDSYFTKWGYEIVGQGWDYSPIPKSWSLAITYIITPATPIKFALKTTSFLRAYDEWKGASPAQLNEKRRILFRACINFLAESIRMLLLAKPLLNRVCPEATKHLESVPAILGIASAIMGLWIHYSRPHNAPPMTPQVDLIPHEAVADDSFIENSAT